MATTTTTNVWYAVYNTATKKYLHADLNNCWNENIVHARRESTSIRLRQYCNTHIVLVRIKQTTTLVTLSNGQVQTKILELVNN